MKTMLTKFEKGLIGVAFMFALLFIALFTQVSFKQKSITPFDAAAFINYEMGRATDAYAEYSLSGRDVDHVYEGLKAKEIKAAAQAQAEAKKKSELKKNEAIAKKIKQASPTAMAAVKPVAHPRTGPTTGYEAQRNSNSDAYSAAADYAAPATDSTPVGATNELVDKNKKTFAQWRALIFDKPTRETLTAFIEAYRNNQITTAEYQAIAQDLLDQPDEKYKGLGIMALRAQPSLASLSQLMHFPTTNLSASLKTYLDQTLGAYLQSQNVTYLNQALSTQDKVLIGKTLTLLNTNLPKISQGDFSSVVDARSLRSVDKSELNVGQFTVLIPALNVIASAQDAQLSPLAQQATSYIQSAGRLAAN